VGQTLKDPTLPQARLTDQDHVLPPPHEVARGQLLDGSPIDPFGVELPIEAIQGHDFAELRLANPSFQGPLLFGFGGTGQQAVQEFQIAQRFSLRRFQGRVEHAGGQGQSQGVQRRRDVLKQAAAGRRLGHTARDLRG
jgi:hypothetical protein